MMLEHEVDLLDFVGAFDMALLPGRRIMGKEFWGYMLIVWAMSNAITWLFGMELETKDKLIMPQIITIFCVVVGIGGYLIGGK